MNPPDDQDQKPAPLAPPAAAFREIISDALRYWEPRRLLYNGVLVGLVLVHFFAAWPGSATTFSVGGLTALFVLAVLANVVYCAAYLPDLLLQYSHFRDLLPRVRTGLLVVGILLAAAIAWQFVSSMFTALP